jgi:hypothetical protein
MLVEIWEKNHFKKMLCYNVGLEAGSTVTLNFSLQTSCSLRSIRHEMHSIAQHPGAVFS